MDYKLIMFQAADLPPAAQVTFARRFGDVQIHPISQYHGYGHPEIYLLSNLDAEGRPNGQHPDKGTAHDLRKMRRCTANGERPLDAFYD